MFTIDDLWSLISYLKNGGSESGLSELTTTLATSEQSTTTTFFEQILDQNTFTSEDYKRLRLLLIDWYSSHKTIATTQRFASDVHQLPNEHLSELFKSFGFPLGLDIVPLTSKANFFLDLVNFYKKKGTPETIVDVLDYYGFSDSDLVEYWLQKNESGNIVFRGESVRQASTGSTILLDSDVSFEKMTSGDPHWIQSKEQIESLLLTNSIGLPSKSPYFSLSSIFSLHAINVSLAIIRRIVEDQYNRHFVQGELLPYNTPVKNLGMVLPILHVYVGSIYAFQRMFGKKTETEYAQHYMYRGPVTYIDNPPVPVGLPDIVKIYEELISTPSSKNDRDAKIEQLKVDWGKPNQSNFLNIYNAAEDVLESLNPDFKKVIDAWFDVGDQNYLITYLIGTLDNWIKFNIDSKSPSLVITMLGIGFKDELDKIINFFKPYRSRLAFMDTSFSIKNPLTEAVLLDEYNQYGIHGFYRDVIRPPSFPIDICRDGDVTEPPIPFPTPDGYAGYYTDYRWDMGTQFDVRPIDQMDDDYYTKLMNTIQLGSGTICDNKFITSIETFIHEKLAERPNFRDYDSGGTYDLPTHTQWLDSLELHTRINNQGTDQDKVIVSEKGVIAVENIFHDNREMEPPQQFDVGASFDSLVVKSIVKDEFRLEVFTYLESSINQYKYSGDTWDYSVFEHFEDNKLAISDANATELTVGSIEQLSGVSGSRVHIPPRSLKIIIGVSTTSSSTSNVRADNTISTYNNNFDVGGFYDIGPDFTPDPPPDNED